MAEGRASPTPSDAHPKLSHPPPPFDSEEADVILRTSDGLDFRVFQLVLSLASPFFKTMFGLPQTPHSSQVVDVQIVPTQEDSDVLDSLLRFCYPCADPVIDTLDELHSVIEAMMKYQMHEAVKRAKQQLRAFAKAKPVAVFAISCRYEWEDLAKTAARASLAFPLRKFDKKSPVKELKHLTGEQHQALLYYHSKCSVAVANIFSDLKWLNTDAGWVWFTCQACLPHPSPQPFASRLGLGYGNDTRHVRRWFMDFMERTRTILIDCPGELVGTLDIVTPVLKQTHGCKNCRELALEQLFKFRNEALNPKIREEIDKVTLELTF
ncbi:hypothetical protein FB451DRAFT_589435 [Mycena latifolia]|nr:hypothetical protein FB451DRAFT_589435 [Mycena latifolia]